MVQPNMLIDISVHPWYSTPYFLIQYINLSTKILYVTHNILYSCDIRIIMRLTHLFTYLCDIRIFTYLCNTRIFTYLCDTRIFTYLCDTRIFTYLCSYMNISKYYFIKFITNINLLLNIINTQYSSFKYTMYHQYTKYSS